MGLINFFLKTPDEKLEELLAKIKDTMYIIANLENPTIKDTKYGIKFGKLLMKAGKYDTKKVVGLFLKAWDYLVLKSLKKLLGYTIRLLKIIQILLDLISIKEFV